MIELEEKYPCRKGFIKNLCELISDTEECFPSALFVHGHAGTGKTAIVKDFLMVAKNEKRFNGAYVDCVECYVSKILFESSVRDLTCDNSKKQNVRCDSLKEFVEYFKNENASDAEGYVLALDNAERIRDMDGNVMPSLLRLQETSGLNICVLLISQIPFEKFHSKTGLTEVITLHCHQYSKPETLKILSTQFEMAKKILKCSINNDDIKNTTENNIALFRKVDIINEITAEFFNNYLNIFLSVFYKACRDIPELKITSCQCFLTYMEPVFNESVDIRDISKLWRNIAEPLRVALSRVYMRFDKSVSESLTLVPDVNYSDETVKKMVQSLELPFYGKYLLIAAFIASHNSAKEDKRLFVKHHGRQKKSMHTVNAKAKVSEKMSISLGPKSFSIDRLLAIFYAIIDEKVGLTCNLLSQISTLVNLKLLGFVSGENNIMEGSARLQCTVGLDLTLVPDVNYSDETVKKMVQSLELPFYGKYLLIAAFIASHNSAKEDKRLFVKHHGRQKKSMHTVNAKAKVSEKMSISLGPKSFSIDRLLAIFYAIIDEKVGLTCNLLSQISTLVNLKLLGFVSGENNIMEGSARLQCTVGLEFVTCIGRVVGFNVCQYLCDFM